MAQSVKPVIIVGSINMDLVVAAPHVPAPGETVLGRDFATIPGGKGANQAVAVARLGGNVMMVGRIGDDDIGPRLLAGLQKNGVDCTHVRTTFGMASGIAMIVVEESGENAITVASGANFKVTPEDVDAAESVLRHAQVCVVQLELPVETVAYTIDLCRRHGVETILDPAPAPRGSLPAAFFDADIISPNETEAAALTQLPADASPEKVAGALRARGCRGIILKLGQRGAYISAQDVETLVAGFKVNPVDTTAAGDAFTGALAVARSEGREFLDAVRFANAAGALACTKRGAQPSMPTRDEVNTFLKR